MKGTPAERLPVLVIVDWLTTTRQCVTASASRSTRSSRVVCTAQLWPRPHRSAMDCTRRTASSNSR